MQDIIKLTISCLWTAVLNTMVTFTRVLCLRT